MSTIQSFDPKKAVITLGLQTVTGFAPDTKATVTRANGVATTTSGVDGDLSINIDSRYNGTLTVSLLHNASFNNVLTSWVMALEQTSYPFFPVEMDDPSGQSISTVGWIETQPDYAIAQETGTMDWVIGLADARLKPTQSVARLDATRQLVKAVIG
jgi:hypothetical protein